MTSKLKLKQLSEKIYQKVKKHNIPTVNSLNVSSLNTFSYRIHSVFLFKSNFFYSLIILLIIASYFTLTNEIISANASQYEYKYFYNISFFLNKTKLHVFNNHSGKISYTSTWLDDHGLKIGLNSTKWIYILNDTYEECGDPGKSCNADRAWNIIFKNGFYIQDFGSWTNYFESGNYQECGKYCDTYPYGVNVCFYSNYSYNFSYKGDYGVYNNVKYKLNEMKPMPTPPPPPNNCTDSDGGKNYNIEGSVSGIYNGHLYNYTDSCSGNTLKEWYCNENKAAYVRHRCDSGYLCVYNSCRLIPNPSNSNYYDINFFLNGSKLYVAPESYGMVANTSTWREDHGLKIGLKSGNQTKWLYILNDTFNGCGNPGKSCDADRSWQIIFLNGFYIQDFGSHLDYFESGKYKHCFNQCVLNPYGVRVAFYTQKRYDFRYDGDYGVYKGIKYHLNYQHLLPLPTPTPTPVPTPICHYYSGDNYTQQGFAAFAGIRKTNYCLNKNNLLVYYCKNNTIVNKTVKCGIICLNNRCIQKIYCKDSDNGKNYSVKGSVSNGSQSATDSCGPYNVLTEYYCYYNDIKSINYACIGKCIDGRCVNQSSTPKQNQTKNNQSNTSQITSSVQFLNISKQSNGLKVTIKTCKDTAACKYDFYPRSYKSMSYNFKKSDSDEFTGDINSNLLKSKENIYVLCKSNNNQIDRNETIIPLNPSEIETPTPRPSKTSSHSVTSLFKNSGIILYLIMFLIIISSVFLAYVMFKKIKENPKKK